MGLNLLKLEFIRNTQFNYFGASVFLHLGLMLYLTFSFPKNAKTSLLPIGVEIVVDSARQTTKAIRSVAQPASISKIKSSELNQTAMKDFAVETSDAVAEKTASLKPVVAGSVESAGSEGVKNGQEVSAEERYIYEVKKWFDRKKVYPQMAKAMGVSGTVLIEFTLNASGEVLKAEIKKGTHPSLDQSALHLVKSIHGQKPFPQQITKTTWTMSVPIEFSLR